MGSSPPQPERSSSPSQFARVDRLCDEFEAAYLAGANPEIQDYLTKGEPDQQHELFGALLELELHYQSVTQRVSEPIDFSAYYRRFAEFAVVIRRIERAYRAGEPSDKHDQHATSDRHDLAPTLELDEPKVQSDKANRFVKKHPSREFTTGDRLGRYVIARKLDAGSFGTVYLGTDEELDRKVAIKVAHRPPKVQAQDMQLLEARVVAKFDHPHIVPVYDVGRLDDDRLFIISKFIDGSNLKSKLGYYRDRPREAARLLAHIAEALDYAHQRQVFHRDVKPANILVDTEGSAYLADFGLALRDDRREKAGAVAGTPAYMSPEQARGESHLVDRRSDVFSLSAVLYELATGARPFPGETRTEVLSQVLAAAPRAPADVYPDVPTELERIILKGLRKRAGDRFDRAADMATDLFAWCNGQSADHVERSPVPRIEPRGLSAYSDVDARFFLRLIPGPRTREGLPESIDFWKRRIDARTASKAFRVGVLYGPSGSGKSSFFRAGLKPRLPDIACCFIRATPDTTTDDWLEVMHAELPELQQTDDIVDAMRRARSGSLTQHRKVLIVFDQFEQWLSANRDIESSEFVAGLRQCDGIHTQAVLLVRDDFWAPLTRCLKAIDMELDANNSALMDVFEQPHAREVLAELGRGYGALCESRSYTAAESNAAFVDEVIRQMCSTGPLLPVRLSLFAHAFRDRPWTTEALQEAGGVRGVISHFLEHTTGKDPLLSRHQHACAQILNGLLPPPGKSIKGRPRSTDDLAQISGVEREVCGAILKTLESKFPLIAASETAESAKNERQYQLAHDYLVPIVRDWASQKLRSTHQGRIESVLIERAGAWQIHASPRALPSLVEWLGIHLVSRRSRWSSSAKLMMGAADRWHLSRLAIGLTTMLLALVLLVHWWHGWRADSDVELLLQANHESLPAIVERIKTSAYVPSRLQGRLTELEAMASPDAEATRQRWRARLGLLYEDPASHLPFLVQYLGLGNAGSTELATPSELGSFAKAIGPYGEQLVPSLWECIGGVRGEDSARRAAGLLAQIAPSSPRWEDPSVQKQVAQLLVASPPIELATWLQIYKPIMHHVIAEMVTLVDEERPGTEKDSLAYLLAQCASIEDLARAVTVATPTQLKLLVPALRVHRDAPHYLKRALKGLATPPSEARAGEEVIERIRGMLGQCLGDGDNHAAFAFAIPREDVELLFTTMENSGFFPQSYRPYLTGEGEFAAISWRFGKRSHQRARDLRADDLKLLIEQMRKRQQVLTDLAYHQDASGETFFAGLWLNEETPTEIKYLLDRPLFERSGNGRQYRSQLNSHLPSWADEGFYQVRLLVRFDANGERRFSALAHKSGPDQKDWAPAYYDSETAFENHYLGYMATDLQLFSVPKLNSLPRARLLRFLKENKTADPAVESVLSSLQADELGTPLANHQLQQLDSLGLNPQYVGSWTVSDGVESTVLWEKDPGAHVAKCKELMQDGWWPHAVAARTIEPNQRRLGSVWHRALIPVDQQLAQSNAVANISISLADAGDVALLEAVLDDQHGRQARTLLLERVGRFERLYAPLADLLAAGPTDLKLRNLLLAMAEYPPHLQSKKTQALIDKHADSGAASVFSAARYTQQKLGIDTIVPPNLKRDGWSTNSLGQAMIHVRAPSSGEALIGAPTWESDYRGEDIQHFRALQNDYLLSATEVTRRHFAEFLHDPEIIKYYGRRLRDFDNKYAPDLDCPRVFINYFDAMLFCQWLTEREGIPEDQWCYPGILAHEGNTPFQMPKDMLLRTGYRLPTEAEYEHACRAGSAASRHFGSDALSLPSYGWYRENSPLRSQVVARLKPNELGFFDMLGNVREWCHDAKRPWYEDPGARDLEVDSRTERAVRGGAFESPAYELRSAYRRYLAPGKKNQTLGFRLARTLPVGQ